MSTRIGGWSVPAVSGANTPTTALKPGNANRQHIVYGVSVGFNGTPSTPVLVQLVDPDVSPNTVIWEGYVAQGRDKIFPGGLAIPPGHGVALMIGAGGGSLIGTACIDGVTL